MMDARTCGNCGNKFNPVNLAQKYCSQICGQGEPVTTDEEVQKALDGALRWLVKGDPGKLAILKAELRYSYEGRTVGEILGQERIETSVREIEPRESLGQGTNGSGD